MPPDNEITQFKMLPKDNLQYTLKKLYAQIL